MEAKEYSPRKPRKPYKKHEIQIKCLGGQLSLQQTIQLIVFIEVFFSCVLLVQSIDLLSTDGNYFYFLHNFEGYGRFFFWIHTSVCTSCIISSFILLAGISCNNRWLILPHLIWQISFSTLSVLVCFVLLRLGQRGKMLMPASVVLSFMMVIPGLLVLWWSYLSCRLFVSFSPSEPKDSKSLAFPAYRQVALTEKIARDLCGEENSTSSSQGPSTKASSTQL